MAGVKIVPGTAPLQWEQLTPTRVLWQGPVEVDAVQIGQATFFVNPTFLRRWTFVLSLHGDEVYRLDVAAPPARHGNPTGRPSGFPRLVTTLEHEHIWVENLGTKCAMPLENLATASHRAILEEFCKRTRLTMEPEYTDPTKWVQLPLSE